MRKAVSTLLLTMHLAAQAEPGTDAFQELTGPTLNRFADRGFLYQDRPGGPQFIDSMRKFAEVRDKEIPLLDKIEKMEAFLKDPTFHEAERINVIVYLGSLKHPAATAAIIRWAASPDSTDSLEKKALFAELLGNINSALPASSEEQSIAVLENANRCAEFLSVHFVYKTALEKAKTQKFSKLLQHLVEFGPTAAIRGAAIETMKDFVPIANIELFCRQRLAHGQKFKDVEEVVGWLLKEKKLSLDECKNLATTFRTDFALTALSLFPNLSKSHQDEALKFSALFLREEKNPLLKSQLLIRLCKIDPETYINDAIVHYTSSATTNDSKMLRQAIALYAPHAIQEQILQKASRDEDEAGKSLAIEILNLPQMQWGNELPLLTRKQLTAKLHHPLFSSAEHLIAMIRLGESPQELFEKALKNSDEDSFNQCLNSISQVLIFFRRSKDPLSRASTEATVSIVGNSRYSLQQRERLLDIVSQDGSFRKEDLPPLCATIHELMGDQRFSELVKHRRIDLIRIAAKVGASLPPPHETEFFIQAIKDLCAFAAEAPISIHPMPDFAPLFAMPISEGTRDKVYQLALNRSSWRHPMSQRNGYALHALLADQRSFEKLFEALSASNTEQAARMGMGFVWQEDKVKARMFIDYLEKRASISGNAKLKSRFTEYAQDLRESLAHPEWVVGHPLRFRPEILREIIRAKKISPDKDSRPAMRIILGDGDYNGAFYQCNDNIEAFIKKGFRIDYFGCEESREAFASAFTSKDAKATKFLLVGAHGSQTGMVNGSTLTITMGDEDWLREQGISNALLPGGSVVLISCSTGKGGVMERNDNILKMFRRLFPHAGKDQIIAPRNPAFGEGILLYWKGGELKIKVFYGFTSSVRG